MKKQFIDFKIAKSFIKRNKDLDSNHPTILEKKQIMNQNNHYYKKYGKIDNLQRRINKLRTANQQTINRCDNCKRCNKDGLHARYILNFTTISSTNIRSQAKFKHITASSGARQCNYILCNECKEYLVENKNHEKYIWPSFLWNILSMGNKSVFNGEYKYHVIYGGEHLWSLIPQSMRLWWIDAVKNINYQNNVPYDHITIDTPPSIFIDKTIDAEIFHDDFNSQQLSRVVKAMNNENVMNMNILCPWSCSTSLHQSGKVPLDLMFQKILPKVVINVYSDKDKFKNVSSSWNGYFRTDNSYPDLLLNDKWKIKPSIIIDEEGCYILTCKFHDKGEDKMYCYAPECPQKGNLNSIYSDQLAHCVKIPRISRPTIASKYSTKFAMVQCRTSFSGCDTMNVTTHSDFSITSDLLSIHEDASIIGRPDMTLLLKQKKTSQQISDELADSFIQNAKNVTQKIIYIIMHKEQHMYHSLI